MLRLPELPLRREIPDFFSFISRYAALKAYRLVILLAVLIVRVGEGLEEAKNRVVKRLMWRRGLLTRPAVHAGMIGLASFVLVLKGAFSGSSPTSGFSALSSSLAYNFPSQEQNETIVPPVSLETIISEKPRDKIITYSVVSGDTLTSISEKFAISIDTIRWANDLENIHDIYPGDTLEIMPVSGVKHKVGSGDTIYSVAKKYDVDAQAVLNFPFNDIDETLSLQIGQILIVPDGVMPKTEPWSPPVKYAAPVPEVPILAGGWGWPLRGAISQYPRWYHMAVDITGNIGTPIIAARSGRVVACSPDRWGYGNHVIIDHGDGLSTVYAHLSGFNVGVGQNVSGGATVVGWVGMTGRTSGPHLHFEIRKNGVPVNPLSYLK
jgi:murein DD-endopeptidase MepM/ murein hydrolase activator NlpD